MFRRLDGSPLTNEELTKRLLYPAMTKAGVPRKNPQGAVRKFHSIRDTYAATVLSAEKPRDMYWLAKRLGHKSITTTETRYAHIEDEARARGASDLADEFAA